MIVKGKSINESSKEPSETSFKQITSSAFYEKPLKLKAPILKKSSLKKMKSNILYLRQLR